jgi:hypothetical protein
VPTASKKIAFSASSLLFETMNAVGRWKVVLTLIAIFVAGAVKIGSSA